MCIHVNIARGKQYGDPRKIPTLPRKSTHGDAPHFTNHHTLLSLPLPLSNIFRALTAHLSLSRCIHIYICIYQAMTTHHTLPSLPLPLSLTYLKHLQRTSLSLSCTPSTLQMTTPLLSFPLALANIFRALTSHLSLSLHSTHLQITTPILLLTLAPSPLSLTYRCRGATDSGHAASACDVHHKAQQTIH